MAYRTEMTIPVNKDPRTFEQRRDDLVSKLERSYSKRDHTSRTVSGSSTTTSETKTGMFHDNIWDGEVSDWVEKSRSRWDQEIANLRSNMFQLEPMERLDNWDPFKNMAEGGHSSSMSSHSSQSTRTVTSIVNGKETSETSTTSSHSTSNTGGGAVQSAFPQSTSIFDEARKPLMQSSNKNFLKDAYEVGEDGQVHFKVRFDAKDFNPENINVTTQNNRLCVNAKQTTVSGNTTSTREFSRSIDLPNSIEHEKFICQMTEDGVLVLDAPVKTPEYKQITFKDGLGIKAVSGEKNNSRAGLG